MMINKFKYRKSREKKVLHKVKKQWVILGTTALAFLAVEAAPQALSNHSVGVVAQADSTNTNSASTGTTTNTDTGANDATSTKQGTADGASSTTDVKQDATSQLGDSAAQTNTNSSSATNLKLVDSEPVTAGGASWGISESANTSNGSTAYTINTKFNENSAADNPVYHAAIHLQSSTVSSAGNVYSYGTAITYQNDNNGNPYLNSGAASSVSNLTFFKTDANGSTTSVAVAASDVSQYVHYVTNITDANLQITDANKNKTSSVSALLFNYPSAYYSDLYKNNEQVKITFDLNSSALNSNYNSNSVENGLVVNVDQKAAFPVVVSYQNENGNTIANDQYLTGDNIYWGNTFDYKLNPQNIPSYAYDQVSTNDKANLSTTSNADGSIELTGKFISIPTSNSNQVELQRVILKYKSATPVANSVAATFDYLDADNSNQPISGASAVTVNGTTGDKIATDKVISGIPDGYFLPSSASALLASATYVSSNSTYPVYLAHKTQTYTINDGSAVASSLGLSEVYTRTINFVTDGGATVKSSTSQTATFTRSAVYDFINKHLTYGDWSPASSTFAAVSDAVAGYTVKEPAASQSVNPADKTFNTTANVIYTVDTASSVATSVTPTASSESVVTSQSVNTTSYASVAYSSSVTTVASSTATVVTSTAVSSATTSVVASSSAESSVVASSSATSSAESSSAVSSQSATSSVSADDSSASSDSDSSVVDSSADDSSATDDSTATTTTKTAKQSPANNSDATTTATESDAGKATQTTSNSVAVAKGLATTTHRDVAVATKQSDAKKLPQTGEDDATKAASLFGLLMMAISGLFAGLYKRQK